MSDTLLELIHTHKSGHEVGIPSICSAHPFVLRAAIRRAARTGQPVLIESTCNQVNQFGGYTGMTPSVFASWIRHLAAEEGLNPKQVLLGGDHLGPSVWQAEPADLAMAKAARLVEDYVQAGYVKIHLDASMRLGGDPVNQPLDVELTAQRAARLARTAETILGGEAGDPSLLYVIGSEVPLPGGAQEKEERVDITPPNAVIETLRAIQNAFQKAGVETAWERVIAVVVQPGVEYGDDYVLEYNPGAARSLVETIEGVPGFVYEAHSTDYQTRAALSAMVRDHFAILKVGPALTFAFREAVFALLEIEKELIRPDEQSFLAEILDEAMLRSPGFWKKYYPRDPDAQRFARRFSFSDRSRYYWSEPDVQRAFDRLISNLDRKPIPLALLSQYFPVQYERVREGTLDADSGSLILDRIDSVLSVYACACAA